MSVTVTMITRDPFCQPWKRADRTLAEAKRRGWPLSLALDARSCQSCLFRMQGEYGIGVVFNPERDSCDMMLNEVVQAATTRHCLMLADDEEPSPALWDFAAQVRLPISYSLPLYTPLPDGRLYLLGKEIQFRLVERAGWKWQGKIDGWDEVKHPAYNNNLVLWHYACFAPREYREAKLARYAAQNQYVDGDWAKFGERHFYEDHPEAIVPMPPELVGMLPREVALAH